MSEEKVEIGIVGGLNPAVALLLKAKLLAQASATGKNIGVRMDDELMRQDASSSRIELGDRKIAALNGAFRLQAAGVDKVIIADWRVQPFIDEIQTEVEVPVISLLRLVAEELKATGITKIGFLGTAVPVELLSEIGVSVVEPSDDAIAAFEAAQNRETGLRVKGAQESLINGLVLAGEALVAGGAQALIPNCAQIALVADDLIARGLPLMDLWSLYAREALNAPAMYLVKPFKVGMIGGLGPAATVDLYDKIVRATPAKCDQEHIKLVVEQNPQIADRTACLLNDGADPTLAMYGCARRLQDDGCDAIIIPCNTAHAFIPYLERHLDVPFINMQQATMEEILHKFGASARIGLMATSGTVQTGIYADKAKAMGLSLFVPDAAHQQRVMAAIYGPQGAKAGYTNGVCREDLVSAADFLVRTYDCNVLILGCTELPLILEETDDFEIAGKHVALVDPTAVLARKVVAQALAAAHR